MHDGERLAWRRALRLVQEGKLRQQRQRHDQYQEHRESNCFHHEGQPSIVP
jgi:hypothetical protein